MDMAVVDSSYMDDVDKVVDMAAAAATAVVSPVLACLSDCFYVLQ